MLEGEEAGHEQEGSSSRSTPSANGEERKEVFKDLLFRLSLTHMYLYVCIQVSYSIAENKHTLGRMNSVDPHPSTCTQHYVKSDGETVKGMKLFFIALLSSLVGLHVLHIDNFIKIEVFNIFKVSLVTAVK